MTARINITFRVMTPLEQNEFMRLKRCWEVHIEKREVLITSNGYVDIGHGGGGFPLVTWGAEPDCEPECDEMGAAGDLERFGDLPERIPPLRSWPEEIAGLDLTNGEYKLEVVDASSIKELAGKDFVDNDDDEDGDEDPDLGTPYVAG